MKKELWIRNLNMDDNILKFCGIILPKNGNDVQQQVQEFIRQEVDMLEFRVDGMLRRGRKWPGYFLRVTMVQLALDRIQHLAPDMPVVFTLRSKKEGGKFKGTVEEYEDFLRTMSFSEGIDIIDVEMSETEAEDEQEHFIYFLNSMGKRVILSKHIMGDIPFEERMRLAEEALKRQEKSGADIFKLAMYVENEAEMKAYQKLLRAHNIWMNRFHIGIAMGEAGKESRYNKDWCDSCLTFVCDKKVVAPGQMSIEEIKEICYNS